MPGNPFRGYLQAYLQNQQEQNRLKLAQQGHDLAVKQLEEMHNYHQGELDRQMAELEHNKNVAAQTLKQHLMENIASGLQQAPENSQVTGFQQNFQEPSQTDFQTDESGGVQLPTGMPSSLSKSGNTFQLNPEDLGGLAKSLSPADRQIAVSSPEQMAKYKAGAVGATESAKVQAEMPKITAEIQGRKDVAAEANKTRLEAARISAESRANSDSARRYAADVGADARKYAADHNAANKAKVNEEELGNQATDVSLGKADLPTGQNGIHVQSVLHQRGDAAFGKKNGGDRLDSLNNLDGIFEDMHAAANMLPGQSSIPGMTQGKQTLNALAQHMPWTTDLKNKIDAVKGRSPEIVRNVFGINQRMTQSEINNAIDTAVTAGMSKEQANQNIEKLRRDWYTKLYSDMMGAMPTRQKVAVLNEHGGLDRWRGANIDYRGHIVPVISKNPKTGSEGMFNINTGNYESIEGMK